MEFRFFDTPALKVASSTQTNNECNFIADFLLFPTFQANYHFPCRLMNWDSTVNLYFELESTKSSWKYISEITRDGRKPAS